MAQSKSWPGCTAGVEPEDSCAGMLTGFEPDLTIKQITLASSDQRFGSGLSRAINLNSNSQQKTTLSIQAYIAKRCS